MTRFMDIALGAVLGASVTGAAIVLADAPTMDPVKLMPRYFKVRLDNARVRVLEFHLKPGEREVMHSHPEGIVFPLTGATVKNLSADGSATTRTYVEGDVLWRDAVTHMGENVGNTEAHFLAVELKNCAK
jgi:beta-alanine degradation protein BauB